MTVVLKDFYADWCGPCDQMEPVVEEIAEEFSGDDFELEKIDVDAEQEVANEYQVRSLPTFIVEVEGEVVDRFVGVTSSEDLRAAISSSL